MIDQTVRKDLLGAASREAMQYELRETALVRWQRMGSDPGDNGLHHRDEAPQSHMSPHWFPQSDLGPSRYRHIDGGSPPKHYTPKDPASATVPHGGRAGLVGLGSAT